MKIFKLALLSSPPRSPLLLYRLAAASRAAAEPRSRSAAGPLTGGIAHLGKDNENGARLAIDEANEAKIKIDGKQVKFTLVAEDDQADPKVGTTVPEAGGREGGRRRRAPQFRRHHSRFLDLQPGHHPDDHRLGDQPEAHRAGLQEQFRVVARDDQQGPAVASYLATNNKPKLVAVIDDATAYGEGIANEVEKTLKAANIEVLPREKGTDKTTDWKAILTKLRGRNPDAVFYGGMDATGGPLLKQGASSASRRYSRSATARAPTR